MHGLQLLAVVLTHTVTKVTENKVGSAQEPTECRWQCKAAACASNSSHWMRQRRYCI